MVIAQKDVDSLSSALRKQVAGGAVLVQTRQLTKDLTKRPEVWRFVLVMSLKPFVIHTRNSTENRYHGHTAIPKENYYFVSASTFTTNADAMQAGRELVQHIRETTSNRA